MPHPEPPSGRTSAEPAPPKVSVVVPVHNPGRYVHALLDSLAAQTMPAGEFEAVLVDDGSTDGTGELLDAFARDHPHVRVLHEEASGWSGRPRNVGIDAARGEYIQFADHDDELRPEALERLYAYAKENGADIVVGKMAGRGRSVPRELFRTDRPDATLANSPLIDSLTPHKMFRRAFLAEQGLRFPEGRRRLEDHVFVTEAYFRSARTSVLSSYVTYVHTARDDAGNAGFRRLDPVGYFGNLREALDIVEAHTGPGALRDRLFRRWLRVEMVERLRGRRLLDAPADWRTDLFREVHKVAAERFGPGVAAGLPALQRAVASAIGDGDLDRLLALAHWEASVRCRAAVLRKRSGSGAAAGRDGTGSTTGGVRFTVRAGLVEEHRRPVAFVHDEASGRDRLAPPAASRTPEEAVDVTDELRRARIEVIARDPATGAERYLDAVPAVERAAGSADAVFHLRFSAEVAVPAADPGVRPAGAERLLARITCCGWSRQASLDVELVHDAAGRPALRRVRRASLPRRAARRALSALRVRSVLRRP